jgi:hypothetical protein
MVMFSSKPMEADMRHHHQRAQMRIDQNKKASYWMEGKEVGRAKLQAAQQKTNGLIKLRQKRCQIFRKKNMTNVIASLHLDMDILNEDILKGNRESILLNLTNAQIEKLVAQKSLNVSNILNHQLNISILAIIPNGKKRRKSIINKGGSRLTPPISFLPIVSINYIFFRNRRCAHSLL